MDTHVKPKPFSELIKGDKPVLVDFYANWCGPCKLMPPTLKELKNKLGESLIIVKVDIDKNPQAASAWKVRSVPTLILFQSGRIKWRQAGVVPASQLVSLISQHLS